MNEEQRESPQQILGVVGQSEIWTVAQRFALSAKQAHGGGMKGDMPRPAHQRQEISRLYQRIRNINALTRHLIAEMGERYDARLWNEIHANDRHVTALWRKVYEIEHIWPGN